MKDLNEAFVHLNVGLPDDVERLKAAGYYKEAVARIDEYLAEDWTETQNSPRSQGVEMPEYEQPANPVGTSRWNWIGVPPAFLLKAPETVFRS